MICGLTKRSSLLKDDIKKKASKPDFRNYGRISRCILSGEPLARCRKVGGLKKKRKCNNEG